MSGQRRRTPAHSRRKVLQLGAMGLAATLSSFGTLAMQPRRIATAAPDGLPGVQYDFASYLGPALSVDGTDFQLGPVFTLFVTARLTRRPQVADQQALTSALAAIEQQYPFDHTGLFACIAYGIPYFNRLPGGMTGDLVARAMPRLLLDQRRYALEEAVPAPTDVSDANPGVTKPHFNIPVTIEDNDLLLTLSSDRHENIADALAWLTGSGKLGGAPLASPPLGDLIQVSSTRLMFVQPGMPRRLADARGLPYAARINPDAPLWMGFASQQTAGIGPAAMTTFQGNAAARFTSAVPGDYFADGAIQHLSHVILDLDRWYGDDQPYLQRVQQMFRSNPPPSMGNDDQFSDGGGPAYLPNDFQSRDDARQNAIGEGTYNGAQRIGHASALQRASRAANGTAFHIRLDGAGLDSIDSPDGTDLPKLHFSIFVPSAEAFERMRRYQAAVDLTEAYDVPPAANGIERFITTTRRQNFLVPPRAHRAFPLVELAMNE